MIVRTNTCFTALAIACICGLSASTVGAATAVNNVALTHSGGFTELSVPIPSAQLCEHFTIPASDGKAFRIVLDFCDATHALTQQRFASLPTSVVRQIRTSQYATDPKSIVRVVLDLRESATYTVRTDKTSTTVAIADPSRSAFARWDASSVKAEAKVTPPPVAATPKSQFADMAPKKDQPAKNPPSQMAKTSRPPTVSHPDQIDAPSQSPSVAVADPVVEESVAKQPAAKKAVPVAKKEPMILAQKDSQKLKESSAKTASRDKVEVASKTPAVLPDKSPVTTVLQDLENVDWSNAGTETPSPADVFVPVPKPFVPPARPLVLAPDQLELGEMAAKTAEVRPSLDPKVMVSETEDSQSPAMAKTGQTVDDNEQLWASTEPSVGAGVTQEVVADESEKSLLDRLQKKFFSNKPAPRPYSTSFDPADQVAQPGEVPQGPPTPGQLDRAALLERIRLAEQNPEYRAGSVGPAPIEENPRVAVQYTDMGRRDPFQPLLGGLRSGFVTDEMPNVENLRMVGVLKDDYDSMALLEDMEGHSYILRAGDEVENGNVISVQEQRTLFKVNDYGWVRTVVLQLSPRGSDPSKTLGLNPAPAEGEPVYEEGNE